MAPRLAARVIEPELLDALPEDSPAAIGSRRDLVRVNAVMFQSTIMARLLRDNTDRPLRILEIGGGDGRFMLSVARKLRRTWTGIDLVTLDQADLVSPKVRAEFASLKWQVEPVVADLFEWLRSAQTSRFDVVTANLFLHHFSEAQLREVFATLAGLTSCFIATEPHRNGLALWSTAWLRALGANHVTLHDAAASVRAGFLGSELSNLWPRRSESVLEERRIGPFTHAFVARKAAP